MNDLEYLCWYMVEWRKSFEGDRHLCLPDEFYRLYLFYICFIYTISRYFSVEFELTTL